MKDKSPVIFEKKHLSNIISNCGQINISFLYFKLLPKYCIFLQTTKNKHTVSRNGFYLTRMSSL